jgi:enoyl-CoA hydratase/carnithine racemase
MRTFHGLTLSWETIEDVVEVRLHRGPCNEIGTTTLRELEGLADHLTAGADGARAALMWSDQERGFSAGADLRELYQGMVDARTGGVRELARALWTDDATPDSGTLARALAVARGVAAAGSRRLATPFVVARVRAFLQRIHRAFDAIDAAPLVTVAAVHGVVFGGGFELALLADEIVADRTARFAFPELRLGLIPGFGGIPRLERDVGGAVLRDLLLSGRSLNAKRAHELGLISQVVAPGQAIEAARAAARQAARFDPAVIRAGKAFVKKVPRARLDEEIEVFLDLLRSPTVEAALSRFVHSTDVRPYLP